MIWYKLIPEDERALVLSWVYKKKRLLSADGYDPSMFVDGISQGLWSWNLLEGWVHIEPNISLRPKEA